MNKYKPNSENLTILMLDLCSYTKLSSRLDREALHRFHDFFDEMAISPIEKYNGQVIKKMGDAFLATFRSPTNALHSAIEIQEKFRMYNKEQRLKHPIMVRISLHLGDVILRKGDIYGDAVNITSRIEKLTPPGKIFFSNSVFMAMNKNEIPYRLIGIKRVKGVRHLIKIYQAKYSSDILAIKKRKRLIFFNRLLKIIIILFLGYMAWKLLRH